MKNTVAGSPPTAPSGNVSIVVELVVPTNPKPVPGPEPAPNALTAKHILRREHNGSRISASLRPGTGTLTGQEVFADYEGAVVLGGNSRL